MAGVAPVEPPKTNATAPVSELELDDAPYVFTGMVRSEKGQGSGFVAENPKTFFTAAHVLFDEDEGWTPPPTWIGGGEHPEPWPTGVVAAESRGYFRWSSYAGNVEAGGQNSSAAFATDLALAWGFEPFFLGTPAKVNFNGYKKLKKHADFSMITGFPATLVYTGESGNGLMHATKPEMTNFKEEANRYLYATHISTGPGNSGGPIWIQQPGGTWDAAGILISGRPSECGIYAFTSATKNLLKAVSPMVGSVPKSVKNATKGTTTSTGWYAMPKPKKIPDGLHKWTKIPVKVQRFEPKNEVEEVFVNLTITTNHRGDLMVALLSPNGTLKMIHDGEGAGADDLVIDDLDLSEDFAGETEEEGKSGPNGTWSLLVQDRLTGDPTVVTRFELEIRTNDLAVGEGGGVDP